MRRLLILAPLGLACFVAGCAPTVNVDAEREALMAADRGWSETTKNADQFVSYLADDATMYPQGAPAMPRAAVRDMFAGMTATPGFNLTWKATKAVVSASGDIGYTIGTSELTMNDPSGRPHTQKGKYLTAWKKQNGAWKVADDSFNDDAIVPMPGAHVMAPAAELKWGPAPPSLPKGAMMAVVAGDPSKPGPDVLRAQFPAGYRISAHWHPTDENVTVLSGTFALGMGEKIDEAALKDLPAGGYATLPAEMRHFAMAKTAATIQIHGTGPFAINYVNPADDPSKK